MQDRLLYKRFPEPPTYLSRLALSVPNSWNVSPSKWDCAGPRSRVAGTDGNKRASVTVEASGERYAGDAQTQAVAREAIDSIMIVDGWPP
jgi:hypothetical protein